MIGAHHVSAALVVYERQSVKKTVKTVFPQRRSHHPAEAGYVLTVEGARASRGTPALLISCGHAERVELISKNPQRGEGRSLSLSLRERVRVRGNETQHIIRCGRILPTPQELLGPGILLAQPVCSAGELERRQAGTGGWPQTRSPAHGCFERYFPLTPALSLGEREKRSPPSGKSHSPCGSSRGGCPPQRAKQIRSRARMRALRPAQEREMRLRFSAWRHSP